MKANHTQNNIIMCCLIYAGAIPFIIPTVLIYFPHLISSKAIPWAWYSSSYAAIILTFLAGKHWGIALGERKTLGLFLLFSSNIIALLAWFALLVGGKWQYPIFIGGFCIQLIIDTCLEKINVISRWYLSQRILITIVVIACLLLQAIS